MMEKCPAEETEAPPRSDHGAAQQSIAITSFGHQFRGFESDQYVNDLFSYPAD